VAGNAQEFHCDIEAIDDDTFAIGRAAVKAGLLGGALNQDWGGLYFYDVTYENGVPPSPAGDPDSEIYITPGDPAVLNCTLGSEALNVWGKGAMKIDAMEIDGRVWLAVVLNSGTPVLARQWRVAVFPYADVPELNGACSSPEDPGYSQAACEDQLDSLSILHAQFAHPLKHTSQNLNVEFWVYDGRPHIAVTALKGHKKLDEDYHAGVWVFDVDDPQTPEWDTANIHNDNVYYYPAEGNAQKYFPYDYAVYPDVNATLLSDPVQIQRLDNGDLLVFGTGVSAIRLGTPPGEGRVDFAGHRLVEDVCPEGLGNQNGVVEPGEEITLALSLVNSGSLPASGITATLTSDTPGVGVSPFFSQYPDLGPGEGSEGQSTFGFTVDPVLISCGSVLHFSLFISSNGGSFMGAFDISIPDPCEICMACPGGLPERIRGFKLTKSGADIEFFWPYDGKAEGGYNLYYTDTASEIPGLRSSNPAYTPFLTAGPLSPLPVPYSDGVNLGLTYYQILGVCSDGKTEGPN
jgi:hypothetical protein